MARRSFTLFFNFREVKTDKAGFVRINQTCAEWKPCKTNWRDVRKKLLIVTSDWLHHFPFKFSCVPLWNSGEKKMLHHSLFSVFPFNTDHSKKKSLVRTELLISNQQTILAWYSVNLLEMNQTSSSEILFSCDWWNSLLFFLRVLPFTMFFLTKSQIDTWDFKIKNTTTLTSWKFLYRLLNFYISIKVDKLSINSVWSGCILSWGDIHTIGICREKTLNSSI